MRVPVDDEQVQLAVHNEGTTIGKGLQRHLFHPLTRRIFPNSERPPYSLGLGLYIARQIAEAHQRQTSICRPLTNKVPPSRPLSLASQPGQEKAGLVSCAGRPLTEVDTRTFPLLGLRGEAPTEVCTAGTDTRSGPWRTGCAVSTLCPNGRVQPFPFVLLESRDQRCEKPVWTGKVVMDNSRYFDANLVARPYLISDSQKEIDPEVRAQHCRRTDRPGDR
jgi:hypothetical protein